ncbi:hypothetical protein F2Q68_00045047, partial [Brassica cretica]
ALKGGTLKIIVPRCVDADDSDDDDDSAFPQSPGLGICNCFGVRFFDDLYQLRLAISFELSYDLVVFLRYKESDDVEDDTESLMAELDQINK